MTEEEYQAYLDSGLSKKAYALSLGVPYSSFFSRTKRFEAKHGLCPKAVARSPNNAVARSPNNELDLFGFVEASNPVAKALDPGVSKAKGEKCVELVYGDLVVRFPAKMANKVSRLVTMMVEIGTEES